MKKIMKKTLLFAALTLVFASCSRPDDESPSSPTSSGEPSTELLDDAITLSVSDKVYDGQPISVTASSTSGRTPVFTYSLSNSSSTPSSVAPKDAGSYVVHASLDADSTYQAASKDASFTISQKEVSLVWGAPLDLEYSGTKKVPSVTANGVISGDTVNVSSQVKSGEDNINVGSFHYEATSLDNPNYKLPENKVSPEYSIVKQNPPMEIVHLGNILFREGLDLSDEEFTLPEGYAWDLEAEPSTYTFNSLEKRVFNVVRAGDANHNDLHTVADFTIVKGDPATREGYAVPELCAVYGDPLHTALEPYDPSYEGWSFEDDPNSPIQKITVGTDKPTYKMSYNCGDPKYFVKEHIDVEVDVVKNDDNIISFGAGDKYYDGQPLEIEAPELCEEVEVSYTYYLQSDPTHPLSAAPVDAGAYTVKVLSEENDHYNTCEAEADYHILKVAGEISWKDSFQEDYESLSDFNSSNPNLKARVEYNGNMDDVYIYFSTSPDFNTSMSLPDGDGIFYAKAYGGEATNYTECSDVVQIGIGQKPAYDFNSFFWDNRPINKEYDGNTIAMPAFHYGLDPVTYSRFDWKLKSEDVWQEYNPSYDLYAPNEYNLRFLIDEDSEHRATFHYESLTILKADPSHNPLFSGYSELNIAGLFDPHWNQKLKDYVNEYNCVPVSGGGWFFNEDLSTSVGDTIGEHHHMMTYIPNDTTHFKNVEKDYVFNVRKATCQESVPQDLALRIDTKLSDVDLPDYLHLANQEATVPYYATVGSTESFQVVVTPNEFIQESGTPLANVPYTVLKGIRTASIVSRKYQDRNGNIKIPYTGNPITVSAFREEQVQYNPSLIDNWDLACIYGPHLGATYEIYFKQKGESDAQYAPIAPTQIGDYVAKFVALEDSSYEGVSVEKEFSIVPREPDSIFVDESTHQTYLMYVDQIDSHYMRGHVDLYPYTDKSVEQLRELVPTHTYLLYLDLNIRKFLGANVVVIMDNTYQIVELLRGVSDTEFYHLDMPTVSYIYEVHWTDTSGSEPVDYVDPFLLIQTEGFKWNNLVAFGADSSIPTSTYNPASLTPRGLENGLSWYVSEHYLYMFDTSNPSVYWIYELGSTNVLTDPSMIDPRDFYIEGNYVYITSPAGLGILFELDGQQFIALTNDGTDITQKDSYNFDIVTKAEFFEVTDPDTQETLNILHFECYGEHYYYIVHDDHSMEVYDVEAKEFTVLNYSGMTFYEKVYPGRLSCYIVDGSHPTYFEESSYDEVTKTYTCSFEMGGTEITLSFQINPENETQVIQRFGNLIVSGRIDDSYLYIYDSGIGVIFDSETPVEDPSTDPYYTLLPGTYDEETHIFHSPFNGDLLYEDGVFIEL